MTHPTWSKRAGLNRMWTLALILAAAIVAAQPEFRSRGQELVVRSQKEDAPLSLVSNSQSKIGNPKSKIENGQAPARAKKLAASAIQIEPVENGEMTLPPEFRMAVYEHTVAEVTKGGKFQHVYRSGDRAAADSSDLVTLHLKVKSFKQGSERTRAVTTVAGATSVALGVQVTGRDGQVLLDRDVEGKVRFFGGNLRATYDFSKKVAELLRQSF